MLKCYKFTEYFRLTEALSLNLPPNAHTEILGQCKNLRGKFINYYLCLQIHSLWS